MQVYKDFGFEDVQVKLALRPEPRMGDDATWEKAEDALRGALRAAGVEWEELPGEGAFYGPKIEYHRSEEHTSELQSLMRISYAVFCLKKKTNHIMSQSRV